MKMGEPIVDLFKEAFIEKRQGLKIRGNSMLPFFKKDQIIYILPVKILFPGKCYLFRYKNKNVLHRLVKVNKNQNCWFIGDNSNHFENVEDKFVIGAVQCKQVFLLKYFFVHLINILTLIVTEFCGNRYNVIWKLRLILVKFLLKDEKYEKKIFQT
jgi:hypothetical protein